METSLNLPPENSNNLWYSFNDSPSAVVFVHGIVSDSRNCWLSIEDGVTTYWPDLLRKDNRLQNPSVFLGGYYTAIDAQQYDVADCAKELFSGLSIPDARLRSAVLDKKRLIFVCHSTGGIVVRSMLMSYAEHFKDKEVGLLLYASPSLGSKLANALGGLGSFYGNALGLSLRWSNDVLKDLDDRFKEFLDQKIIARLHGGEACENHFIVHRRLLPNKLIVVDRASAGRYFSIRMLPNTDHYSIVKPTASHQPQHNMLVQFWIRHYGPPFDPALQDLLEVSRNDMRTRDLPYFTPALLRALLYQGSFASSVLNSISNGLARELEDRFSNYLEIVLPASYPGPYKSFDWFDRDDVKHAQLLALQEGLALINERLFFKAILLSQSQTITQLKTHMGKEFDDLLREVDRRRYSAPPTPYP
jgi:hypothetical protein